MTTTSLHVFDQALQLRADAPGQYQGESPKPYWNMVGPFGGVTAATLLQAVLQHPERLGDPLALTVNYGGGLVAGSFQVQAVPVRTNRSTQHWTLSILQSGPDGAAVVTTTGTAVTAVRRDTWSAGDTPA
ncbi:MAG: acyl-CoA thioesterase domain-containing protein, partial [Giesbergeria sp.]